jgi:hypothetical protein
MKRMSTGSLKRCERCRDLHASVDRQPLLASLLAPNQSITTAGMLVTRPYGDPARFQASASHLLESFASETRESVS